MNLSIKRAALKPISFKPRAILKGLRSAFTIRMPEALVTGGNPVYWLERRRIHRAFTGRRIRFMLVAMIAVFCIVPVLFGVNYVEQQRAMIATSGSPYSYGVRFYLTNALSTAFFILSLISILLMFIADLFTLAVTSWGNDLNRNSEHWDLVALSGLAPGQVVAAKQTIAQMRAWRFTVVEIALRASIILVVTGLYAAGRLTFLDRASFFELRWDDLYFTSWIIILAAWIFFEPYWRMRATVANGVQISTRIKSTVLLVLICFGMMFWMRIRQALILYGIVFIASQVVQFLGQFSGYSSLVSYTVVIVTSLVLLLATWLFYVWVEASATRRATARILNRERVDL